VKVLKLQKETVWFVYFIKNKTRLGIKWKIETKVKREAHMKE